MKLEVAMSSLRGSSPEAIVHCLSGTVFEHESIVREFQLKRKNKSHLSAAQSKYPGGCAGYSNYTPVNNHT